MKRNYFKNLLKLSWLVIAALAFTFTSCDDDDDGGKDLIIEDGIYVKGLGTALTDYDAKGLMSVTRNEVTQEDRSSLYELYVAVEAGSGGFNIVMVTGGVPTVYGPGADFATVAEADRDVEEPQVDFARGSYAETATPFTVAADGLYHVVIDTELMKVAVIPVEWGIIGGATPLGWGGDTELTQGAFDLETMTFSITDMELRGGDWKFRYSGGWKVILDAEYDLGEGKTGVKVNTNLGGSISDLAAGGDNIVNDAPGVYTISLTWALASGYAAEVTKTDDLPLTNWTDVICDAVGTGVSVDNANAIADPSSWSWGNKLLADGAPTKEGDVYTWTWTNIVLEANEGFKLRTENGVAPDNGNGANFDVGYSAVDTGTSSSLVADKDGNLSVTAKGTFVITLTVDAANSDTKEIVITEVTK
jgi:hypothetical protein